MTGEHEGCKLETRGYKVWVCPCKCADEWWNEHYAEAEDHGTLKEAESESESESRSTNGTEPEVIESSTESTPGPVQKATARKGQKPRT